MRARLIITVIIAGSTTACASHPGKIEAAYVSPMRFQSYSCEQLTTEMQYVGERTNKLYHKLKKIRKTDNAQMAVGLLVLWPVLFFIEGGDGPEAAEYAQLKGEFEALRQNTVSRECNFTFRSPDEIMDDLAEAEDASEETSEDADAATPDGESSNQK